MFCEMWCFFPNNIKGICTEFYFTMFSITYLRLLDLTPFAPHWTLSVVHKSQQPPNLIRAQTRNLRAKYETVLHISFSWLVQIIRDPSLEIIPQCSIPKLHRKFLKLSSIFISVSNNLLILLLPQEKWKI